MFCELLPNINTITQQGSIYSIAVHGENIFTGGQDCKVKRFSSTDLSEEDSWQLDASTHGRVKALAFVGDNIAVGTHNNGMLLGRFGDDSEQIIFVSSTLGNLGRYLRETYAVSCNQSDQVSSCQHVTRGVTLRQIIT